MSLWQSILNKPEWVSVCVAVVTTVTSSIFWIRHKLYKRQVARRDFGHVGSALTKLIDDDPLYFERNLENLECAVTRCLEARHSDTKRSFLERLSEIIQDTKSEIRTLDGPDPKEPFKEFASDFKVVLEAIPRVR
ncbi:MAG TPA: hypothetical protein VKA02_00565, partial [Candidatus Acidoferrum sp.]|nr:hypothetical protein [Candidatus Acidoferrum sp.]